MILLLEGSPALDMGRKRILCNPKSLSFNVALCCLTDKNINAQNVLTDVENSFLVMLVTFYW